MKDMVAFLKLDALVYIIIAIMLCLLFITSLNRQFDYDEFEAIHSSWKIFKGGLVYKDFFQHHNPFLYYMLSPLFAVFGEGVKTPIYMRGVVFLFFLSILFISYLLARKVGGKDVAFVAIVLLITTVLFTGKAVEIRPDVPYTLFGMLSVLFLYSYFEKRRAFYLSLSA